MEYVEKSNNAAEEAARMLAKMENNKSYLLWLVVALLNVVAAVAILDSIISF